MLSEQPGAKYSREASERQVGALPELRGCREDRMSAKWTRGGGGYSRQETGRGGGHGSCGRRAGGLDALKKKDLLLKVHRPMRSVFLH